MSQLAAGKKYRALDKFEVLGELGVGAASRILHIRDPESYQHYAMKIVIAQNEDDRKFLEQAKNEYEVARRLDHPSLLKVYDVRVIKKWFREREVRTLLEYINGSTVEQMSRSKPSVPLLVVIFSEVAAAVAFMHRRGFFHADLKPNNILVSRSGQVKVIDFGLSWQRGEQKRRVQGTMGYLAPEQMRDRVVTEATDIFNFGATLYKVLTGRMASGGVTGAGGTFVPAQNILTAASELRGDIPEELCQLISRCCETKPMKRPASMNDVAESLTEIMRNMQFTTEDLPALLRESGRDES